MENKESIANENKELGMKVLTIPNILTFLRIFLIPFIIWAYCIKESVILTTIIIVISGLSDVVDGYIARKFNMISDFGKGLDPIADKLTQFAILVCLVIKFPLMFLLLLLLVLKEAISFVLRYIIFQKTNKVDGALWHGKVNTVILYSIMLIHIIWIKIPFVVSDILIAISATMMILSFVLYTRDNIKVLLEINKEKRNIK